MNCKRLKECKGKIIYLPPPTDRVANAILGVSNEVTSAFLRLFSSSELEPTLPTPADISGQSILLVTG